MKKISIIIVNYNVRNFVFNAINSIQKSLTNFDSEIFVVDNASTDGSVEYLKEKFPNINLISNKENVGFAQANNQALKIATGDYLVLINPDTLVQEDTFLKLAEYFESHADVGMLGCKVLNPDGTLQMGCRRSFPTPWNSFAKLSGLTFIFPKIKMFAEYNLTYRNENETHEVDAISGSFMMITKEVYQKVGGLDETFFMYGEDIDWCYRIKKIGWKIIYLPSTQIIHFKGESTKRSNIDELKVFYSAMRKFFHKHYKSTFILEQMIELGILVRHFLSSTAKYFQMFVDVLIDSVLVFLSIILAEYIRKGSLFSFPVYAYPYVYIVPIILLVTVMYYFQAYTVSRHSTSKAFTATFVSYLVISTITAFVKDFAFSRIIILLSATISLFAIPGWRVALKIFSKSIFDKSSFFKSSTIIVGTNQSALSILNYFNKNKNHRFKLVGCVDNGVEKIGSKWNDIEILGSFDMLERIIEQNRISEVIISKDTLPYSKIMELRTNPKFRFVNFRVSISSEDLFLQSQISLDDELPLAAFTLKKSNLFNRIFK